MCNFSNNNQSATNNPLDNQQAAPTVLELIKMAAELAAIDNAADAALYYSPIPNSAIFHVNVGDFNIFCNITNAARDVDRNKQATAQQESKATDHKQESKATTDNQQQQKITEFNQQQLPEKFRRLYYLIADFLGSYSQVKINIAPGCETDSVRISFINKGESTGAENMFFGVTSIPTQRYFRQQFEHFSVFPGGDAFSVTIKGCEVELSKLITKIEAEIKENKRNVKWARYNY